MVNNAKSYLTNFPISIESTILLAFLSDVRDQTRTMIHYQNPGGGDTKYICPTGICRFSGYRFRPFFLEQGIKRRPVFWSRLSEHVKRGNFVTTGYYLVKFLCF